MAGKIELSRETFLYLADRSGLDSADPHMDKLYAYVKRILPRLKGIDESELAEHDTEEGRVFVYVKRIFPKLKSLHELDLTGVEPALTFSPPRRDLHE